MPPGHQFLACLTHDVDFLGIRRHRLDRTLAGFLLRASLGSLSGLIRGRRSLRYLLRNWAALLSLPLVFAGVLPDFWLPFDRYINADGEFRSTFFIIPFAGRPGRGLAGPSDPRRSVRYAAREIRPWLPKLRSLGFEVAVHGIDAWCDRAASADELREVAELTGHAGLGVRMHWLYFDGTSFTTLEHAGFRYDATVGYNDAVGFRAGTTQVFRPLSVESLLELPLHIQDTALFFPGRMNCAEQEALGFCGQILDWTQRLGGVSTLSWHERSLVPERQWDGVYRWLLAQLRQRAAYVAPARDVISWFSARRSVDLEGAGIDPDLLSCTRRTRTRGGRFACAHAQDPRQPPRPRRCWGPGFRRHPGGCRFPDRAALDDPGGGGLNGPRTRPSLGRSALWAASGLLRWVRRASASCHKRRRSAAREGPVAFAVRAPQPGPLSRAGRSARQR